MINALLERTICLAFAIAKNNYSIFYFQFALKGNFS